jgi:hypothetical protein
VAIEKVENSESLGIKNVEDWSDTVTDDELGSASQLFDLSEFVRSTEQSAARLRTD